MKQIMNKKDLIGKTIKNYYESFDDLWIRFTDDSFVIFRCEDKTDGFDQTHYICNIFDYEVDNTYEPLVNLGLISENEYNIACEEEDRISEERMRLREMENEIQEREREIKLLEELKMKYEK
jgi:hypothetical protein